MSSTSLRNYLSPAFGSIVDVVGRVGIVRSDGAAEQIGRTDVVRTGDFLFVAGGSVTVLFGDGSRLKIVGDGQALIDRLEFDTAHGGAGITLAAAGAHFEVITSTLVAPAAAGILVETPVAKIHALRASIAFHHDAATGLELALLDNAASEKHGAVVENAFGEESITDPNDRILVAGIDHAPVLEHGDAAGPSTSQAEPAGEPPMDTAELEFAAGGDENALPGDPIVVSGAPAIFDLSPEPAPLQSPAFSGIVLQTSSLPSAVHHTEELLIGTPAPIPTSESSGEQPKTLTGWEPLDLVWQVRGSAEVSGPAPELPYEHVSSPIKPTEKGSMAALGATSEQTPPGGLELFLGLPEGALSHVSERPVEGSAIRARLSLSAGTELSFDFFFDAGDRLPRDDFAVAVVGDHVFKLSDVAATGDGGASGWRTFVFKVATSGVYTIGFAAVGDRVGGDPSPLYVDNVRLNRTFGSDYVQVDGSADGSWRTLVQRPTVRDDTLSLSENGTVATTAVALLANDSDPDPFNKMGIVGIDRTGTHGQVTFGSTGTITYTAAGRFDGLAEGESATDSFRYEVDASSGARSAGTVHVTITGVNDAPKAGNDEATISAAAQSLPFDVLRNDDDIDSDDDHTSLRIVEARSASGATVGFTGEPRAGITYDPAGRFVSLGAGEMTTDTVTYLVEDRHGARGTGTVLITITGPTTRRSPPKTAPLRRRAKPSLYCRWPTITTPTEPITCGSPRSTASRSP